MGMFDSVYANCPNCGKSLEFQSKSGSCLLRTYDVKSVPLCVVSGCNGDEQQCECGSLVKISVPMTQPQNIQMSVEIVK